MKYLLKIPIEETGIDGCVGEDPLIGYIRRAIEIAKMKTYSKCIVFFSYWGVDISVDSDSKIDVIYWQYWLVTQNLLSKVEPCVGEVTYDDLLKITKVCFSPCIGQTPEEAASYLFNLFKS